MQRLYQRIRKLSRNENDLIQTATSKNAAAKKIKLRVTGYSQGESIYSF